MEKRSDNSQPEKPRKTAEQLELDRQIDEIYRETGLDEVMEVSTRNILIIGRTRTGKSTIQNLLIDPRIVPPDLTALSVTRNASFRSFILPQIKLLLNVIDTPGVFERHNDVSMIRSDEVILETITQCVNLEITKFHMVCFAFAMTAGIQKDDIDALKLFMERLGESVSNNACLIITRCESKTKKQQEKLKRELLEDTEFKKIASYFKLGIFFTGSINYDDYDQGEDSVIKQFKNILKYRKTVIDVVRQDIKPFQINQSCISDLQKIQAKYNQELESLRREVANGSAENQKHLQRIGQLQRQQFDEQQRVIKDSEKATGGCIIC